VEDEMSVIQQFPRWETTAQLYDSDEYQWYAVTEWIPVCGLADIRVFFGNTAVQPVGGTFSQISGFQTATIRTDRPNDWSAWGTPVAGGGSTTYNGLGSSIGTHYWVRFGVGMKNDEGSADLKPMNVTARAQVTVRTYGRSIGKTETTLLTRNGGTAGFDNTILPVTGWLPTMGLKKVAASVEMTSRVKEGSIDFEYRLVWRSAADSEVPSAWAAVDATWINTATANSTWCSGEIGTEPANTNVNTQLGIEYKGGAGQAYVRMFLSGRWE
jgi:hypothetical protein